jgi:hypothetical protein
VLSPVGGRAQLCGGGGFRRLAEDYARLPETVVGLCFVAFAYLFLYRTHNILSITYSRQARLAHQRR